MGKNIMIQGTMSNAGKSLLAAGLCRVLRQDGYTVAPFKSQNMALNSFITASGGEMGRAQVVQAEAAGIAPDVRMNPILLKPTTDMGSQVIVNGRPVGNMNAMEYYRRKAEFVPAVLEAYRSLESAYDVVVIEGAGSPAEINLKREDIVNMGSLPGWWTRRCSWWGTSTGAASLPSSTAPWRCWRRMSGPESRAWWSISSGGTGPSWSRG